MAQDLSYVIISGGTGANAIASAFGADPAFVLPVSDDGGSSSEILRCFGGPSIGDIPDIKGSRLTRLIPLAETASTREEKERSAIYELLAYRFPDDAGEKVVREIWGEIVEGRSSLWKDIGDDKKECIRAFLVHFNALTLKRAHKRFSFRNFSLGNGFLTGARDMFGSLPSAIFLFKSVASVAPDTHVIPVINTNQTVTIAAELEDGETIVGQCAISHPTEPAAVRGAGGAGAGALQLGGAGAGVPVGQSGSAQRTHFRRDSRTFDTLPIPLGLGGGIGEETSPKLESVQEVGGEQGGNLGYRKGAEEVPLESPVKRVFYINLYGQEIFPQPNPSYLESLKTRDVLVYSCGSIWTSIAPCLSLRGLGEAVARSTSLKAKVLLLNSKNDRESPDYLASDYVKAISNSLTHHSTRKLDTSSLITHVVYLEGSAVEVDEDDLRVMGVETIMIPRATHGFAEDQMPLFTPESVSAAMGLIFGE